MYLLKRKADLETTYGSQWNLLGVPIKYDLEMRLLQNIKLNFGMRDPAQNRSLLPTILDQTAKEQDRVRSLVFEFREK